MRRRFFRNGVDSHSRIRKPCHFQAPRAPLRCTRSRCRAHTLSRLRLSLSDRSLPAGARARLVDGATPHSLNLLPGFREHARGFKQHPDGFQFWTDFKREIRLFTVAFTSEAVVDFEFVNVGKWGRICGYGEGRECAYPGGLQGENQQASLKVPGQFIHAREL